MDLSYEVLEGMTLANLKEQCKARGMPVSGTKATLIARLLPKKRGKPPANLSASVMEALEAEKKRKAHTKAVQWQKRMLKKYRITKADLAAIE
ncbi:hypothetical protein WJX73_000966 [Symbiochloris irregularis]|uniref:SAP domain-containing protein n=1 Tax=Symbiochloris irregularis TaxID=706552 RepID=A0AAW1PSZ5_9CHLO